MIFTGKYGNMNFIIKITYYPTLSCEYYKSTSPNIYLEEGHACNDNQVSDSRTNILGPKTHRRLIQMMPGRE